MRIAVLVAVVAALAPQIAHACKKRHQTPFELFGEADTVAFVSVRKTPSNSAEKIEAGDVELVASRVVKGTKVTNITAKESETDCRASYVPGKDLVVFLRPDGLTVGAHDGVLRDVAAWKPIIEQWAVATDPTKQVAVLVDAVASGNAGVAAEAIEFLVDDPVLIDTISPEQTARIAKAAKTLEKGPDIVMLLVRLHDASAPARANVPLWARVARGVLRAKSLETDTNKLAEIVAKSKKDDDPRRIAAMERCERVHGKKLAPFFRYFGGAGSPAMWKDLAEACRSGNPI